MGNKHSDNSNKLKKDQTSKNDAVRIGEVLTSVDDNHETCVNAPIDISSFAFNLFAALASENSDDSVGGDKALASHKNTNILISPYSIASALSLVLAGATISSQCQKELQQVLNAKSHSDIAALTDAITKESPSPLTTANGIWSKDLKESYVDIVRTTHRAEAAQLPSTYAPIDAFISQKTNGLISNMLGDGAIDPLTVAVLINAVHFKSDWANKFQESATRDGLFTKSDGTTTNARFMIANRKMNQATNVTALNGASIVQLDYGCNTKHEGASAETQAEFAAFFVLPPSEGENSLNEVIQCFVTLVSSRTTNDNSDEESSLESSVFQKMYKNKKVNLMLPRFKMEYGVKSIKKELQSLGIHDCFGSGGGTLQEMSNDMNVYIDDVLHKAVIEVTEEGTEAAAATAAIARTRSMPPQPVILNFDRPFLMVIMHMPTKTPLFLAKVVDPEFHF